MKLNIGITGYTGSLGSIIRKINLGIIIFIIEKIFKIKKNYFNGLKK